MKQNIILKDGMVVELRNGDKGLVVNDRIIFNNYSINRYNYIRTFYHQDNSLRNIVKVYDKIDFNELDSKLLAEAYYDPLYSRLDNGMIVKLRSGDRCLVMDNVLIGKGFKVSLKDYSEEYTHNETKNDIVEIYNEINSLDDIKGDGFEGLKLLWSKKED